MPVRRHLETWPTQQVETSRAPGRPDGPDSAPGRLANRWCRSRHDDRATSGVAYAAPELIAHYVEAHGYLPPADFVAAVLSSEGVA
ncbi:DUF7919 family protein [Streptomyces violaceus]